MTNENTTERENKGQPHGGSQSPQPDDSEVLKQALADQKQKVEQYLANWQRAGADLANYKKQAEQDKQSQITFANAMLISSLLPVLDDLERAFDTVDSKLAGLTWVDGLHLIYRKLQATLEAQGLRPIQTAGADFDPKLHEAVMEVDGAQGKVISQLQKGYRLHDRVLRPAIVTVGRGQPATPPQTQQPGEAAR